MPAPIRLMVFEGYAPGYGFYNAYGALQRPLLKRGDRGASVVEAQNALMNVLQRALYNGADGIFGPDTEKAVKDAQARNGLAITGTVNADTWTLLLGQEVQIGDGTGSGQKDTIIDDGDIVVGKSEQKAGSNVLMTVGALAVIGALAWLARGKR